MPSLKVPFVWLRHQISPKTYDLPDWNTMKEFIREKIVAYEP